MFIQKILNGQIESFEQVAKIYGERHFFDRNGIVRNGFIENATNLSDRAKKQNDNILSLMTSTNEEVIKQEMSNLESSLQHIREEKKHFESKLSAIYEIIDQANKYQPINKEHKKIKAEILKYLIEWVENNRDLSHFDKEIDRLNFQMATIDPHRVRKIALNYSIKIVDEVFEQYNEMITKYDQCNCKYNQFIKSLEV